MLAEYGVIQGSTRGTNLIEIKTYLTLLVVSEGYYEILYKAQTEQHVLVESCIIKVPSHINFIISLLVNVE